MSCEGTHVKATLKLYKRNNLGATSSCLKVMNHKNLEDLMFSS